MIVLAWAPEHLGEHTLCTRLKGLLKPYSYRELAKHFKDSANKLTAGVHLSNNLPLKEDCTVFNTIFPLSVLIIGESTFSIFPLLA